MKVTFGEYDGTVVSLIPANDVMKADEYSVHGENIQLLVGPRIARDEVVIDFGVFIRIIVALGIKLFPFLAGNTRAKRQEVVRGHVHQRRGKVVEMRSQTIAEHQR